MSLKLIVIYAAYGDALLLQTPDVPPKYWLIDGGPINPSPVDHLPDNRIPLNAYYQYLKRALYRYCCSQKDGVIDSLAGIIVTHPDGDHMDGINRLLRNDMVIPAKFKGPVVLNSTFYRPGGPPLEYPLAQFLDQVNHSSFGLSEVPDPFVLPVLPDPHIPTNMKNGSLAGLYKMVDGEPRNPYPRPADFKWEKYDLDKSTQNWSSIITMWLDPGPAPGGRDKLSLVTTGDGLPSYILNRMKLATPWDPIPALGIFKVSHHGSEYNNQWADNAKDYVGSGDIEHERKFFFCLTMLALQYSGLALKNPPSPPANVLTMDHFKVEVLHGSPMLDWTVVNEAVAADFEASIQWLSNSFSTELQFYAKTAKVDVTSFNLQDDLSLRDFADALVARYNDRKSQIIDTGVIADGTPGASKVTFSFDKKAFRTRFMKGITSHKLANPKYFETLFNCLDSNALDDLRKARLVQNFYSKFTANNYVISGNRFPHGHPKPSVLAGMMAHLILTVAGVASPRRIFVTDGASIPLDYVYDLVTSLLSHSARPLLPPQWNQKVRVYYLATDFLAEIPVDLSHVNGVREIDFSNYASKDNEDYLTFLHNQFMKAKPYDMPRAAISHTTTFRITIRSDQDVVPKSLDMDAAGNLLVAAAGNPLFNLQYIDHTTANVARWSYKKEPHFELFTDAANLHPIPDLVFLIIPNHANPALSNSHVSKDNGVGLVERLHLANGVVSFQAGAGITLATVQFERNPGI
ncbi:hypothetical protein GALMADRAFT_227826 [Galerina marginata CBS 339.88]|uniref:Uncharacterized protein n=1 Tax=Galerina marginata (strain CBS 339.88) TaxID=685588 RepID=A0A067ST56_GALM3|nr:hypothetical protein GALMADRAFT_227826 [Galerina marginata CBS 339.88]